MASQVKAIFASTTTKVQASSSSKDKLAQTKLRERELRDVHRAELTAAKEASASKRSTLMTTLKEERALHDTKRAAKDRRDADRRQAHASTGQECEHGVWRCKICFPHKESKPRYTFV